MRRVYCDRACMAAGMVREDVSLAAHRWRAQRARGESCAECGTTEGLHAHHRDGDPSNDAPENIETLCASCHLKWHWRHGKKSKPRAMCSVCGEPARKRGLCDRHFQRWKKYGDPRLTKKKAGAHGFVLVRE